MKKTLSLKKETVSNLTKELLKHTISGIENIRGGGQQQALNSSNDPVRIMYSTKKKGIIINPIIIAPPINPIIVIDPIITIGGGFGG